MSISGILSSSSNQHQLSASNLLQQELQQLGGDLQSGNLSAAQKDYSTIQQDLQRATGTPPANHFHHHHRVATSGGEDSSSQNSLLQDLNQLGQSLTSSNLSSAQQAYSSLQQQLQQFALGSKDASELSNLPVSLEV
jgi:hypothetical protein